MPRLPTLSGKEVCRILADNGFSMVRQRGSHIIMQEHISGPSTITVPVPDHKELRKGTLQSITRNHNFPAPPLSHTKRVTPIA